ncbi:hypothetical protein [Streptomyces griseus]|uniref:hypothetical protein n=1 Tax=Streptomyces griseus TaxID=1911 RepID=UPI0004C97249|nr:hypothetical protein [Streptomyces griseus]
MRRGQIVGERHDGADEVTRVVVSQVGCRQRLPSAIGGSPDQGVLVGDMELIQAGDPHDLPRQVFERRVAGRLERHGRGILRTVGFEVFGFDDFVEHSRAGRPGAGGGMGDGLAQRAGRRVGHDGGQCPQFVVGARGLAPGQDTAQDVDSLVRVVGFLAGQDRGQGTGAVVVVKQGHHAALAGGVIAQEVDGLGCTGQCGHSEVSTWHVHARPERRACRARKWCEIGRCPLSTRVKPLAC